MKETNLCPSLSLGDVTGGNVISQAALPYSANQQQWKSTPDKHQLSHTHTHTLAGKQFHKLTYKVEKVCIDMNKQTSISRKLTA